MKVRCLGNFFFYENKGRDWCSFAFLFYDRSFCIFEICNIWSYLLAKKGSRLIHISLFRDFFSFFFFVTKGKFRYRVDITLFREYSFGKEREIL